MRRAMEKKPPPRSMLKRRRVLPTQKKMLHMTKSNNDPGSPIFLISWKHPSALSIQPSIHKDSITTCLVLLNVFGMLLFASPKGFIHVTVCFEHPSFRVVATRKAGYRS